MSERLTPADFPLINECVAQGDTWALFPLMKNWSRERLNALLAEVERADEFTQEAWARLALQSGNFFSKRRSQDLDKEKMESLLMLSEICSVALYYMGRKESEAAKIEGGE